MGEVLDKRTADNRWYTIDCTALLEPSEVITEIISLTADQGGIVFTSPTINVDPIVFQGGTTAAPGKAVQVEISGGAIPEGQPYLPCIVRPLLRTTLNPAIEATVVLRLVNTPNT